MNQYDEESRTMKSTAQPTCLISGIDSLYVGYNLDLATSNIDFEDLEYRKSRIREGELDNARLILGSETFDLAPYGAFPYRYVLQNDVMTVALAERLAPSVKVQFSSKALWHSPVTELHRRVAVWAESIGATARRPEIVIRADWAFDFHLAQPDFSQSDFLSRAVKESTHGQNGRIQTFQFGRGDMVVRVYDKVAEVEQQSGKAWFFELWGRDHDVWRVEFQVRGQRLKRGGIRTVSDLIALQGDLLRQLAEDHTTLRRPTGDSNRARWPLHPLWQSLQTAIGGMDTQGLVRSFDEPSFIDYRLARLAQSTYGNLKALAALIHLSGSRRGEVPDLSTTLDTIPDLLETHHSDRGWARDVEERLRAYEVGRW